MTIKEYRQEQELKAMQDPSMEWFLDLLSKGLVSAKEVIEKIQNTEIEQCSPLELMDALLALAETEEYCKMAEKYESYLESKSAN